ncbi:MAG: hypothetical protein HETSPECPRED_002272 [Heterodermia speciosa]|uniref:SMP domain-containing protein n=1 Tax=Heterodermia speciosa TaxID=116794 RepID=A0A8H3EYR9_9LECA|nr:MAG: hypothetical protein HETSPECPRED_002272 [Heterodermia speciosa]
MSAAYEGQDPLEIAKQAERDLNSSALKQGDGRNQRYDNSTSAVESGIDESAVRKFPGSEVTVGSAASGAGDNREIPVEEGGDINRATGQPTKARDFEGEGGPEDKAAAYAEANPGSDDVTSNVRQVREPKGEPIQVPGIGKAHSAMD